MDSRRLYGNLTSPNSTLVLARSEVAAGRMPILSFKVPHADWQAVGDGRYDRHLIALRHALAALDGQVFVALHHEPAGDGDARAWVAMQRHALPILSPPGNVLAGVIVNGFWWSARQQGLTDREIARWLPPDLLSKAEIVAADTYQGGTAAHPGEDPATKIRRLSAWARRAGVPRLGIGEYNGLTAAAIRTAGDAILDDPRYAFAACFNSNTNNRNGVSWALTSDRLAAFKDTLRRAQAEGRSTGTQEPRP